MERRARTAEALFTSSSGPEALEHAIRAAELYMRAAGEAPSKSDAARFRRKCQELIARAESLKSGLAPEGQVILTRSSRLHGNDFPPWTRLPADTEFQLQPGVEPFLDKAIYALSSAQAANFAGWTRPGELFFGHGDVADEETFMASAAECDFVQDVTTDCSVVASLSAAVNILTGRHEVLSSIIYPFDKSKGRPKLSASGKYILRMHFNGCDRRVVIDDRLPASKTDRTLFVVDRQNPRLIWPALLEKAYLKVRGGYDFPGSNSGTDLWVLTGWIPEQLFLQREDFNLEKTWARIKAAHDSQDVVITLGTGRTSGEEEEVMGLIGEHDYAVQELDEAAGLRRMLVKNPWCNGPIWKGAGSSTPRNGVQPEIPSHLNVARTETYKLSSTGPVWVTLEDVAQHFEFMYLNWNPGLFAHRQDHHFDWELPPPTLSASLVRNPQFSISCPKGGLIWILISRHFVDEELDIARQRARSPAVTAESCQLGYMSILLFDSDGHRVQVGDGREAYRGPYVDSLQTLARFEASPGKRYTVVLDQHALRLASYPFTMSVFSTQPLQVKRAEQALPHSQEQAGLWGRRTAGGNASCSTYFLNPQYRLSVPSASPASILLSTNNHDLHVHVDIVWAQGKRAVAVRARDLVASSGEYRRGCAVADIPSLDPGVYTIVCSTFEPGQTADFTLLVTSAAPVELEPVPRDTAGRLRTSLAPVHLAAEEDARRAALSASFLTRASIWVRGVVPPDCTGRPTKLLRVTVVLGRGPERLTIASSGDGEFQELGAALRTPEFDIEPERLRNEGLWLVVESIGEGLCDVECEIFSDSPIQIGAWEAL
ncbi:Calpain-like protease palB/cpr-8 [Paramyrothecium foliicola]|nr:Calpain-like protease palB/cpr-8 [Paramyrothecium foliicola]